jgi:hypothetical protein
MRTTIRHSKCIACLAAGPLEQRHFDLWRAGAGLPRHEVFCRRMMLDNPNYGIIKIITITITEIHRKPWPRSATRLSGAGRATTHRGSSGCLTFPRRAIHSQSISISGKIPLMSNDASGNPTQDGMGVGTHTYQWDAEGSDLPPKTVRKSVTTLVSGGQIQALIRATTQRSLGIIRDYGPWTHFASPRNAPPAAQPNCPDG